MSIIQPVRTRTDLAALDLSFGKFPNAVPFSPRSAIGYQDLLESLYAYVTRDIYNYLLAESGQVQWDSNVDLLLAAIDSRLAEQNSDVNAQMNDAVQQVINGTIPIVDGTINPVILSLASESRKNLDSLYKLTEEKLLGFVNNEDSQNPAAQFHARLTQLYGLTSQKILEAVNIKTNSPFRNWLEERFPVSQRNYWTPNWGGNSGARLGDNGVREGSFMRTGDHFTGYARLIFGSTAISGGSVLVGANVMGPMDPRWCRGRGTIEIYNGNIYEVILKCIDTDSFRIYVDRGNGLEGFNVLGNMPQQSVMALEITGSFQPSQ